MEQSYGHFVRHFGKPAGFSSPGFYSDERVMALLDRLGLRLQRRRDRRRARGARPWPAGRSGTGPSR